MPTEKPVIGPELEGYKARQLQEKTLGAEGSVVNPYMPSDEDSSFDDWREGWMRRHMEITGVDAEDAFAAYSGQEWDREYTPEPGD